MRNLLLGALALAAALSAQPRITAVGNGADFANVAAPGSLATVFGTGLAASTASAASLPFPTTLNGVSISVGGRAARINYVSATQVNFQIPYGAPAGSANVTLTNGTQSSNAFALTIAPTVPAVFQYGANRGVVQNQDSSLNTALNPASSGSVIIAYLTGIGLTAPAVPDGDAAPGGPLAIPPGRATAAVGGVLADVLFLGLTPGNVGLAQANIRVPLVATGDHPLTIQLGGRTSRPVQISVRGSAQPGGPLPEGVTCISGPVDYVVQSKQNFGRADEVSIGGTRLCAPCPLKPPVYVNFAEKLESAREDGLEVDVCHDDIGTINYVRMRR